MTIPSKIISYQTAALYSYDPDEIDFVSTNARYAAATRIAQIKIVHYANLGGEEFARAARTLLVWAGVDAAEIEPTLRKIAHYGYAVEIAPGLWIDQTAEREAIFGAEILTAVESPDMTEDEYFMPIRLTPTGTRC